MIDARTVSYWNKMEAEDSIRARTFELFQGSNLNFHSLFVSSSIVVVLTVDATLQGMLLLCHCSWLYYFYSQQNQVQLPERKRIKRQRNRSFSSTISNSMVLIRIIYINSFPTFFMGHFKNIKQKMGLKCILKINKFMRHIKK